VLAGTYLLLSRKADRWQIGLLLCFTFSALALLVLVFDSASRYSIALFPVAAVLVGAGLPHLLELTKKRLRLEPILAAIFLGIFVWYNLNAPADPLVNRELGPGMLTPDRRPHGSLAASLAQARHHGPELLLVVDNDYSLENLLVTLSVYRFRRPGLNLVDLRQAKRLLAGGRPIPVLMARFRGEMFLEASLTEEFFPDPATDRALAGSDTPPPPVPEMKERFLWVLGHKARQQLKTHEDAYGLFLTTHILR
jgi:hypothetical protein